MTCCTHIILRGIIWGNPYDHIQTTIPQTEQELLCHKAGIQYKRTKLDI